METNKGHSQKSTIIYTESKTKGFKQKRDKGKAHCIMLHIALVLFPSLSVFQK